MTFPQGLFPPQKTPLINYDWVDVAAATGYVIYDCYKSLDSVSIKRSLIPTAKATDLYSISSYTTNTPHFIESGNTTSLTYEKIIDLDFDTSDFQLPRKIKGTAYIKLGGFLNPSVANTCYAYFILKVRKWDGSTETEIASVQTPVFTYALDVGDEVEMSLQLTIPLTSFKKGEQLRLTIEGWGKVNSDTLILAIGGDPQDRADSVADESTTSLSAGNSRIILIMPYKIEV